MIQNKNKYDLEERTLRFAENIIDLCKSIRQSYVNSPIINQLIRASSSIGANYSEANNASSKKDFKNKIFISKKECQETKYWLTLLKRCCPEKENEIKPLWQECHELNLIFQKIINSLNKV